MMLSRFFEIVEYFLNKPTPGLILLIAVLSFCTWLLHGVAEKFKSTAILGSTHEAEALKKLVEHLLSLTPQALDKAQRAGELMEVTDDA